MSHGTGAIDRLSARGRETPTKGFAPIHRAGLAAVAGLLACCGWTAYSNIFGADIYPSLNAPAAEANSTPGATILRSQKQDRLDHVTTTGANFTDRFAGKMASLTFADRFSASQPTSVPSNDKPPLLNEPTPASRGAAGRQDPSPAPARLTLRTPLPSPRPSVAFRPQKPRPGPTERTQEATGTPAEEPTFFEQLFGKASSMLAYASADPGIDLLEGRRPLAGPQPFDRHTAIYAISAKAVYLPDGTKLEAHSGLGDKMDNPTFAHVKMRGPTPPHLYDLTMRESLFHGVQAIRLNPIGGDRAIHGRVGLLAHSYMLGVRGDSNGCVSIKDYEAFLRAYRTGHIKRLAVVAKL